MKILDTGRIHLLHFSGDDWSPEAADDFETITHAAQWKKLLAKIVRYEEPNVDDENDFDENVAMVPVLELVDTNTKDVSIFLKKYLRSFHCSFVPGH